MATTHQYFSPVLDNRSMPPGSIIPELGYRDLRAAVGWLCNIFGFRERLWPPESFPFGERQYTVEDTGGYRWTYSQSITDTHPSEWGGELLEE